MQNGQYRASTVTPTTMRASLVALLGLALVAGCTQSEAGRGLTMVHRIFNSDHNPQVEVLEQTVEFVAVPASRAMVSVDQPQLVLERRLRGAVEQRVILPNDTAVRGDNVMHLRAQTPDSASLTEFSLTEVESRFGGLPAPFERLTDGGLNVGQDALGSYVFASTTIGVDTTCVLVLRRLGVGARILPQGTQALDVMLRNCAPGTVQQALAPASERALSIGGSSVGTVRSLSPFAAPRG